MRDPDRTGKDTPVPLVLLPKVPAFPSRGWCSCLAELEKFLHLLKIGLILGRQTVHQARGLETSEPGFRIFESVCTEMETSPGHGWI